ncbi:MAG: hypothetical protein V4719_05800 [Planctomycetota bacterium]
MIRSRLTTPVPRARRGAASLDYILTLGVLFTMSGFIVVSGRRIMQLVYELTGFFLAWPFM